MQYEANALRAEIRAALSKHGSVAAAAAAIRKRTDSCPDPRTTWSAVARNMERTAAQERDRVNAILELGPLDNPTIRYAIDHELTVEQTALRLVHAQKGNDLARLVGRRRR